MRKIAFIFALTCALLSLRAADTQALPEAVLNLDPAYDLIVEITSDGTMNVKWYPLESGGSYTLVILNKSTGIETEISIVEGTSYSAAGFDPASEYEVVVYSNTHRTPVETPRAPLLNQERSSGPQRAPLLTLQQQITALDLSQWPPQVTLTSSVTDLDTGDRICGLGDVSHWQVRENGNVITDCFDVLEEGFNIVDVVFCIDYSGSMGDEIASVKANVKAFADSLVARGWDWRLGFVRFGSSYDPYQNPVLKGFTNDVNVFKGWIDERGAYGGTERGLLAVYQACNDPIMTWRPGSQRRIILITDEDSDGGSLSDACNCCISKDITVDVFVNYSYGTTMADYVNGIRLCTDGLDFSVWSNYNTVLGEIGTQITDCLYFITFCSPNTLCDGSTRTVELTVNYGGQTATATRTYVPCACPIIERTPETIALSSMTLSNGANPIIEARVVDSHAPYVQWVKLYYRRTGTPTFTAVDMSLVPPGTNQEGIWRYQIMNVVSPGFDYYIVAFDGECSTTDPTTDPTLLPHQVAVEPNYVPQIVHTPVACGNPGVDISVTWEVYDPGTDDRVVRTCLYYRRAGTIVWTEQCINEPVNPVAMSIPGAAMTVNGVQYYLTATDTKGITAYQGIPDNPLFIPPCGCCIQPILSLVGYRQVSWTDPLWTVQVEVRNGGPCEAYNVNVTMNEEIPWLTIPDPTCAYGNVPVGATSWGNDSYTFDLTANPGGSFNVWFDVTYEDACGNHYRVRLDPEFEQGNTGMQTTTVAAFKLAQNYPNPFNPNTTISYQIAERSLVKLSIFDVSGRLVRTLVNAYNEPGLYAAPWDGKDHAGHAVTSGVYFYQLQAGTYTETKRMVLLR